MYFFFKLEFIIIMIDLILVDSKENQEIYERGKTKEIKECVLCLQYRKCNYLVLNF